MKWLLYSVAAFLLVLNAACFQDAKHETPAVTQEVEANAPVTVSRCYGYTPCTACKSCTSCEWCRNGGKCGICVNLKESKKAKYSSSVASPGRCQAITKKVTQSSPRAR
jgi:hypothetical protein